jgi:uncharacterized membrane protein YkoI
MLTVLAAAATAMAPALADEDADEQERDHYQREEVRGGVERGELKPLSEVLQAIRPSIDGEIVGVEIERKGTRWVYELRVARPDGGLTDVYVDAATATILKTEVK